MTAILRHLFSLATAALLVMGTANAQSEPGMHKGEADAPLVLIEYVSPTCSHCKQFVEDIGPTIDQYVKDGKVRVVLREYLRNEVDVAIAAMARCAPNNQYFDVLNAAFAQQDEIIAAAKLGKTRSALVEIGKDFGIVDETSFDACYGDTGIRLDLAEISQIVKANDPGGVPAVYVNGTQIKEARPMLEAASFAAYLDSELAKTAEPAN